MSKLKLADLIQAEREATPGPWRTEEYGPHGDNFQREVWDSEGRILFTADDETDFENVRLIALSRNTLPALLEIAKAAGEIGCRECRLAQIAGVDACDLHERLEAALDAFDWEGVEP